MSPAEIEKHAREMEAGHVQANLVSLSQDSRFAAVLRVIDDMQREFIRAGCDQKIAGHHGPLAHCQGSVHALEVLRGRIRQMTDPRLQKAHPTGPQAP